MDGTVPEMAYLDVGNWEKLNKMGKLDFRMVGTNWMGNVLGLTFLVGIH
jgi:hypothetical protein